MSKSVFQLSDGSAVSTETPDEQAAREIEGFSPKAFVSDLREDLANNRLALPTLPNLAIEALFVINDIDSCVDDLVKVISKDTSLTARLIRYANSPLFRGVSTITTIKAAVTRIGFKKVKNAVYAVSMKEVFRTPVKEIEQRMENLWAHSVTVAAHAAALAKKQPHLEADVALVAGLIHDIGKIPLLIKTCDYPELVKKPDYLDHFLGKLHPGLGRFVLKAWKFDPRLIAAAADHENLARDPGDEPVDYVDVVLVANILSHEGTDHPLAGIDRTAIPAFARLGIDADGDSDTDDDAGEIGEVFF